MAKSKLKFIPYLKENICIECKKKKKIKEFSLKINNYYGAFKFFSFSHGVSLKRLEKEAVDNGNLCNECVHNNSFYKKKKEIFKKYYKENCTYDINKKQTISINSYGLTPAMREAIQLKIDCRNTKMAITES